MADKLRDYQLAAVDGARAAVLEGESPCIAIPTGGGKTHVGVKIVTGACTQNLPVLWMAHREELIKQGAERLERFGIKPGIIMGGHKTRRNRQVQVASVQTLAKREKPPATVIVLDEAHHVRASTYMDILDAYPEAFIVGLTATPVRLDGRGLGDVFDRLVVPISCAELVERGFLMEPKYFAPAQPDLQGVRTIGGDYSMGGASKVMMDAALMGGVVEHYHTIAPGRKAVLFACNVKHSKALVERFNAAKYRAEHIDGKTPRRKRAKILAALRAGSLDIVSNVNVLTEGWDLPGLEVCVVARPTASWSLHMQMIGRVMRVEEGKPQPVVIDHAGNLIKHGFPTDEVVFDLSDSGRKKSEPTLIKVCPACLAVVSVTSKACEECGHVFQKRERGPLVVIDGKLKEVKAGKPTPEDKSRLMDRLLGVARGLGYKRKWATVQYKDKMGVLPRGAWYRPLIVEHFEACTHVKREGSGECRFCNDGHPMPPEWTKGAKQW